MEPSFEPDMMGTVISTGSASPAVIRKCSSPEDVASPLGATFHAFDTGKLLAAPATCTMAAATAVMSALRIFIRLRLPAGAPRRIPGRTCEMRRLFAFHFDADVADVRIQELEREIRLAILLLDQDVLAVIDFDAVPVRAQL